MIKSFSELWETVKSRPSQRVVIPGADTISSIKAAIEGKSEGIADFILIGEEKIIRSMIRDQDPALESAFEIINESSPDTCVQIAVSEVKKGNAGLILKGKITTSQLMNVILNKERGLQTTGMLSDVFVFETPDRLTLMTDGGIVMYPTVEEKIFLINNTVKVAHALGNPEPRVALIAAVEIINLKMPATVDAAIITQMNRRGQIPGCIVDGPLALDNAISLESARIKGIESHVAGFADVLIMPSIETGNTFGKALTYYAHLQVGHVVMGAQAPILITSRSDDSQTKLNSIALGIICS
ncbi:MAG: hypothetical protein JW784_06835 [Candidatus Cloacimonetes bacterium]|nr:hypothetical protein [Candidatus Cloacimonadota bacterium]